MSTELEIRERHREHLKALLDVKEANKGYEVKKLDDAIKNIVVRMNQEDVAYVEKIVGVKALD